MSTTGRTAALRKLDVLIGRWDMEPVVEGRSIGVGWTTFEWADDGAFVRQTADAETPPEDPVWRANSPLPTLSIIGLDDSDDAFTVLYADARDVFRVYKMTLADNVWRQWRAAPSFHQRFTGTISADGTTITAMWEFSEDGESWRKDFDLLFRRTA
ncbi:hypothetical protein [Alloactinosynnema sp. L-07]|uniref:hypothetical protein n=1 Tax=Alloactinosynnema sp. L-07 TaxID=1653480 RepID=UPI00065EF8F1|nr:hypothetical protein [Alloactinosynnema sp. L-07]CRK57917.1 hypothetical protein [Alloactinosynnema sp. L-07]